VKDSTPHAPYQPLGKRLRYWREQIQESLAEAAGAVEIDIDALERIEQGLERPSEDILLLLINHFDMHDNEAVRVWELAGYDDGQNDRQGFFADASSARSTMVVLAMDMRTQYTDGVQIDVTPGGVTMCFTQGKGQPVARVGMSSEQAEVVLRTLQTALLKKTYLGTRPLLPPSVDRPTDKKSS
jgi:transcriptional regulator with XRE-family HTH domain